MMSLTGQEEGNIYLSTNILFLTEHPKIIISVFLNEILKNKTHIFYTPPNRVLRTFLAKVYIYLYICNSEK